MKAKELAALLMENPEMEVLRQCQNGYQLFMDTEGVETIPVEIEEECFGFRWWKMSMSSLTNKRLAKGAKTVLVLR